MDSDYPLIPISVKEEILKYGKDRTKKDSFLFRYLFVNSFKDQETFFLDNSFPLTLEYRQFVDMALSKINFFNMHMKAQQYHKDETPFEMRNKVPYYL
jgi:hypothetical protein